MKKLIGVSLIALFLANSANAEDLVTMCRNGVKTEIFTAKAAKYKYNGSINSYESAKAEAQKYGSELGYPDEGIDMMINAGVTAISEHDKVTEGLASLDTSDSMISSLVDDCLKTPKNYIRNYTG